MAQKCRRITVLLVGGVGNQLFIYNAAHHLARDFAATITLINVIDRKSEPTRQPALQWMIKYCSHKIESREVRVAGLFFRFLDYPRFVKLRNMKILRPVFKRFNVWIFDEDYQSKTIDQVALKPRICRGYYQEFNLVSSTFQLWEEEFFFRLEQLAIKLDLNSVTQSFDTLIHIRRGDVLTNTEKVGMLSNSFFSRELNQESRVLVASEERDIHLQFENWEKMKTLDPEEFGPWEILALARLSREFIGSNSTLSWWCAIACASKGDTKSVLPVPWTKQKEFPPLRIISDQVRYAQAIYF